MSNCKHENKEEIFTQINRKKYIHCKDCGIYFTETGWEDYLNDNKRNS